MTVRDCRVEVTSPFRNPSGRELEKASHSSLFHWQRLEMRPSQTNMSGTIGNSQQNRIRRTLRGHLNQKSDVSNAGIRANSTRNVESDVLRTGSKINLCLCPDCEFGERSNHIDCREQQAQQLRMLSQSLQIPVKMLKQMS